MKTIKGQSSLNLLVEIVSGGQSLCVLSSAITV